MVSGIDEDTAKLLAVKFFAQKYSNIVVKRVAFKGTTWIITVSAGIPAAIRQIRIDAVTGRILGVE